MAKDIDTDWFTMERIVECANCGREGDLYTLEEARRRCGTGYGEWYCMEGEGCTVKKEEKKSERT
jgi:hypothetical protein